MGEDVFAAAVAASRPVYGVELTRAQDGRFVLSPEQSAGASWVRRRDGLITAGPPHHLGVVVGAAFVIAVEAA